MPKNSILALVQRCRFCNREMKVSPLTYLSNPFCTKCYDERVGSKKKVKVVDDGGGYVRLVEDSGV